MSLFIKPKALVSGICILFLLLVSCREENIRSGVQEDMTRLSASTAPASTSQTIALTGNAFFTFRAIDAVEVITDDGLANWTDPQTITSIHVPAISVGVLSLKLRLKVTPEGKSSTIKVTVEGQEKTVVIFGGTFHDVPIGDFDIPEAKTVRIDLQGVSRTSGYYGDVSQVIVSGSAVNGIGNTLAVPLAGNSFVTSTDRSGIMLNSTGGIKNWTSADAVISTYVFVKRAGNLSVFLRGNTSFSSSILKVTINGVSKEVNVDNNQTKDCYVGDFNIQREGYVKIDLQGVSKTGDLFGEYTHIVVGSEAVSAGARFCNVPASYHWARRGPSSHFIYHTGANSKVSYYYNEVTVPVGYDPIGTYYMAIGFAGGYFGIQTNSPTRRAVLFSVWSRFQTDDPNKIPKEYKVKLNRKGASTITGEFGGEGSGGQSFINYNWITGNTYRFLVKGQPDNRGNTDFTAWFYAPEKGAWELVASFKQPKYSQYLTGFNSFLEGFSEADGYLVKRVEYSNPWIYHGTWQAVNAATYSVDDRFLLDHRSDVKGGVIGSRYYLQMGGFFNDYSLTGTVHRIPHADPQPDVDLSALP